MGWGIHSHAPAASTPGKDLLPIVQEAGWAPEPVWTGGKSRPHRNSIPYRPARSSVAIPTELPDPPIPASRYKFSVKFRILSQVYSTLIRR